MGKRVAKNDFQEIVIFKNHKDNVIGVYGYDFVSDNVFQCDVSYPHHDLGYSSIPNNMLQGMILANDEVHNFSYQIKLMDGTE